MANLNINRGTTYTRTGTVKLNGTLIDLTSATVRFTMKTEEFDADTDDSTGAVVKNVTNATALGAYTISLAPADTATLEPGKYFYDIKVDLNSDGASVYKVDEGTVKLDGSPTNRLA